MNYLKKNLHNSIALPYDIMKIISEYAEPYYLKQIENKDYNLDDIMYRRMINLNIKCSYRFFDYSYRYFDNDFIEVLDKLGIVYMYKNYFLQENEIKKICGLNHHNLGYRKYLMILDLRHAKIYKSTNTNYEKYKMKNVYKKWLKL